MCDLHTLLEICKDGASASYLSIISLCTVDPVGAKYITKTLYIYFLNGKKEKLCDYIVTWHTGYVTKTLDANYSETQRYFAYGWCAKHRFIHVF